MTLNGATKVHQETAAINPTYNNVSYPGDGQQSTYTALDFQNTDNKDYQEISTFNKD